MNLAKLSMVQFSNTYFGDIFKLTFMRKTLKTTPIEEDFKFSGSISSVLLNDDQV